MKHYLGYVPILRSQASEFDALKEIQDADRQQMTPLINILPSTLPATSDLVTNLKKMAVKICTSWPCRPLFIDLRQVSAAGLSPESHPVTILWQSIREINVPLCPELGVTPIPVTGLARNDLYEAAVRNMMTHEQTGVCLRVIGEEARRPTFWSDINNFLIRMKCSASDVHLLIDFQLLNGASLPNVVDVFTKLPYLKDWQSLTIAAGSFPKDLTLFKAGDEYQLPRLEWQLWRDQVVANLALARRPGFGDYGICYPFYIPPPAFPSVSASIRYASADYWVIMRGRAISIAGSQQYPEQAAALCDRTEFSGANYSAGDAYIAKKAEEYWANPGTVDGCGNPRTWLRAGFNHHMTLTARTVAALSTTVLDNVTLFPSIPQSDGSIVEQYKVLS